MRVNFAIAALLTALVIAGCRTESKDPATVPVSSRAYKGHETDADMNNLVAVYNYLVGTRLDDCQTCHKGGDIVYATKTVAFNACSFCHLVPYPDATIVSGAPANYADTLNSYGVDYKTNGRSQAAIRQIASMDSDGDSYVSSVEIENLRYPGDNTSMPGQPFAPTYTTTWEALHALASHTEFLLQNSHKQQFDEYANYKGVKVKDILAAAGVVLAGATSITIIAPDGFMKDFTLDNMNLQYPDGIYDSGLAPADFPDPAQGFVTYPPISQIPPGLADMGTIPDQQWLLIAYMRDGADMDACYLDPISGKINGEGPYRIIVPQTTPGTPDRGSNYSPTTWGDGYDYSSSKDHNAGSSVRGVVAIRVNPMPAGFEEFDWKNGGWSLIQDRKIIIYGEGVTGN